MFLILLFLESCNKMRQKKIHRVYMKSKPMIPDESIFKEIMKTFIEKEKPVKM